jgi:hypothetical protein
MDTIFNPLEYSCTLITLEPSELRHACLIDVDELLVEHGKAEVGHEAINLLNIIVSFGILNVSKIPTSCVVTGPRYKRAGSAVSLHH